MATHGGSDINPPKVASGDPATIPSSTILSGKTREDAAVNRLIDSTISGPHCIALPNTGTCSGGIDIASSSNVVNHSRNYAGLADWESQKATIHSLYMVHNVNLQDTMRIMELRHGFCATYVAQFFVTFSAIIDLTCLLQ